MRTIHKVVVSVAVAVALFAASAFAFANHLKGVSGDASQPNNETDVYGTFLSQAKGSEQTEALAALRKDNSLGVGVWKREALKILGQLPQASNRLSMEEAEQIVSKEKDMRSITTTFNKVAGAPDWEGGSGIERLIYYTDDSRKEAIVVMLGKVLHVIDDDNGEQKVRELSSTNQQAAPQPTSAP